MSTTRKIAERIANDELLLSRERKHLADAIDSALLAERERAVRIIKEHRESDRCEGSCWEIITTAIRQGNTDAAK